MLRAAVAAATPVGLKAKEIMDRGDLVPDEVMIEIINDRLEKPDTVRGFILDGFPRTIGQADALTALLARKGLKLDAVIEISVDETALQDRITGRAKETGGARADDTLETLQKRLAVYRTQTAPLVEYYRRQGLLKSVDGMGKVDEVTATIEKLLSARTEA
jgi:adenylate kinase